MLFAENKTEMDHKCSSTCENVFYVLHESFRLLDEAVADVAYCDSNWTSHMTPNLPTNAGDSGDMSLVAGFRRSPGGGKGNHSNILAWKTPWSEEFGGLRVVCYRS